ncbi:hypothetical protein FN846DRAFT_913159 [Sphaerosporella brunnea]|uniref:DUF726 domain protein n=1 Tax=Sphaerosporella brunnea TaxID=1250544 RepID=A0A5J5EGK7_9PEZI|nr:hypothetical protein FN846DRAFT_913159 [Sphaerosporella brunnea]
MAGEPHSLEDPEEEITMSFEPVDDPKPRSAAPPPVPKKPEVDEDVEYDEFGLPVRKLDAPAYDDDDDEITDDETPPPPPPPPPAKEATATLQPRVSPTTEPAQPLVPAVVPVAPAAEEKKDAVAAAEEQGAAASGTKDDAVPASSHRRNDSIMSISEEDRAKNELRMFSGDSKDHIASTGVATVSEWSHQQIVPRGGQAERPFERKEEKKDDLDDEWQEMPAYAPYDLYDDDGRLIARARVDSEDEEDTGAAKGYTRVYDDEDAESVTSMDENTSYLFKENDDDEAARNPLSQMKATKELLTEGQRVAYVGVVRLGLTQMLRDLQRLQAKGRTARRNLQQAVDGMVKWSQKIMVRLYTHMELSPPEQIMIEQLAEHGVLPSDLTPSLLQNSRVHNPMAAGTDSPRRQSSIYSGFSSHSKHGSRASATSTALPEYQDTDLETTKTPSQLPQTKTLDIDLRWTVLCDLFLVLIADSVYDSRARVLLERVGTMFDVSWLDICKFERRVTDALEMQESADQNWSEQEHLDARRKAARNKRFMMLGLATVGGGLVIGLSGGLLAPVIGAGLAAGFTTIGVAGTGGFLAGAGGTALIASSAAISGSVIGGKAGFNRMKSVSTFEFKPLHNAKRVNLIITISGWMNGKIDDVRLPFSTVDPIMGDLFSLYWEPEMLQSMGQTISILATEALTQTLQQVLGSTILISLMAAIQLPVVLTKLAYLLDNPWSVSLDRAAAAGLILADTLVHRNLGVRPVTLVGYSLGARVIYFCLLELARLGASGLVQNVYMFGSPVVVKRDEFVQAASMVSGRFVNGYATNDWILGYLFRATSGGIGRIAGLAPVDIPGVENVDVTELVNGHMAYRAAMPKLLMKVGWEVSGDEFSEIEEPDPDGHQQRQRELINELDEARKELEQGSRKRKWNFFGRNKDPVKKKDWEMYEATTTTTATTTASTDGAADNSAVLFDIDAIRAEIEKSQKEEQQPQQLEKQLETLKVNDDDGSTSKPRKGDYEYDEYDDDHDHSEIKMEFERVDRPASSSGYTMHTSPSYGGYSAGFGGAGGAGGYAPSISDRNVWAEYDEFEDHQEGGGGGEMKMTFA